MPQSSHHPAASHDQKPPATTSLPPRPPLASIPGRCWPPSPTAARLPPPAATRLPPPVISGLHPQPPRGSHLRPPLASIPGRREAPTPGHREPQSPAAASATALRARICPIPGDKVAAYGSLL
ncbi:hypothetical protein VPH35_129530 [Triticum aestivum]